MSDWKIQDDRISWLGGHTQSLSERQVPSLAHGLQDMLIQARGHKDVTITLLTMGGQKYVGKHLRMEQVADGAMMIVLLTGGSQCCTDCWPNGGHAMPVDELVDVEFLWEEGPA